MSAFDICFQVVVRPDIEGGYVDDPDDPGGETKFGITKRDHPHVDIKNLTLEGAKKIYHDEYWLPCDCATIQPRPAKLMVFDCAVNQGVSVARRLWNSVKHRSDGPELFMAMRAVRYSHTINYGKYGRGWMKRLFVVNEAAYRLLK